MADLRSSTLAEVARPQLQTTLEPQATIAVTMDLGAATNIAGAWPAAGTARHSAYGVERTIDAVLLTVT